MRMKWRTDGPLCQLSKGRIEFPLTMQAPTPPPGTVTLERDAGVLSARLRLFVFAWPDRGFRPWISSARAWAKPFKLACHAAQRAGRSNQKSSSSSLLNCVLALATTSQILKSAVVPIKVRILLFSWSPGGQAGVWGCLVGKVRNLGIMGSCPEDVSGCRSVLDVYQTLGRFRGPIQLLLSQLLYNERFTANQMNAWRCDRVILSEWRILIQISIGVSFKQKCTMRFGG